MSESTNAILADIRKRNDERKAAEARGVIGGVRTGFDVDFLLRYIDQMAVSDREGAK
jgi:hypothetical protein